MVKRAKVEKLDEFFMELNARKDRGVFFCRINGYNKEIGAFITKYYEAARKSGVIIEGNIPNPDEKNLAYYNEIMGMDFQMSLAFISASLKKWLPRMSDQQRESVAGSIFDCLNKLKAAGKNENMLKNAYIKFMCWLYYKFERIVNQLGNSVVPKILYEADIGNYELLLIQVLANAGCDVVLLQYAGDANYLKLDPQSEKSEALAITGAQAFPNGYSLKQVRQEIAEALNNQRLYGTPPKAVNCTNAWIEGKRVLDDMRTPLAVRGSDESFFYNCFCRICGVEDKLAYLNELHQFYQGLKSDNRKVLIIDGECPPPTMDEIASVRRANNYDKQDRMLLDLSNNITYTANVELQRIMIKVFLDLMLEESKAEDMNIRKLTNKGVYLICWLKRYMGQLFSNWKMPDIGCFIHMGPCKSENEVLFIRFLARLPIDVLLLSPNLNEKCELTDELLYEVNYTESLSPERFPQEAADLHVGTSAYHAERELDTLMYQDSGIYRNQQYSKADAITLRTMYEEIKLLWKEEAKYRPNFGTTENTVNIPVIWAKVSGVKDGDVEAYWNSIRELMQEEAFLVMDVPHIDSTAPNPMKAYTTEFYKNHKLQKKKIREHKEYPYAFLREEMQEHILDKLELLIDRKIIKGTFENGTEYTIIATVLNLDKELTRAIQKFDFTKKNPKLIYVITGEKMLSLEDSIVTAFLNLLGFDIVFFVPTGYQSVEKYFNEKLFEEHQIGEYLYDLRIPDLRKPPTKPKKWRNLFSRRG